MRMARNTLWNVAEVIIGAAVLFLLYRLIIAKLGVEALGIWALVLATTAVAKLADVGVASGLGRFVALQREEANAGTASPDARGRPAARPSPP